MDYFYASDANERIVQGSLPQSPLHSVSSTIPEKFDFYEKGRDILEYFERNPEVLYGAIRSSLDYVSAAGDLLQANKFVAPFNIVVNTAYNPAALSDDLPAYKEANLLNPVVTDIDKALWLLVSSQAMLINTVEGEEKECLTEMFFAWLYLLKTVQENEYIFGKTLDFSSVSETGPVLEVLISPWNEKNTYAHFTDLTPTELDAIHKLEQARKALKDQLTHFVAQAEGIAAETDDEWELFLRILNGYSMNEAKAVNHVLSSISKAEKREAIFEYISLLKDNNNDRYIEEDQTIEITPVVAAAKKRLQHAPAHCFVSDDSGHIFRLHHYAVELATFPMTFNYLLLVYHLFRLDGRRDIAQAFCNLALDYLKRNLSFSAGEDYYDSIEELAEKFCNEFNYFIDSNKNHLDNLSFDDIQQDTVFIGNASLNAILDSALWNYVSDKIECAVLDSLETSTESIVQNQYTKERLEEQFDEEQEFVLMVKAQIVPRQAIASLNIAYLFCEALRIMQENNKEYQYFTNNSLVEKCLSILNRQTGKLSYNVYTSNADIDKYRLDAGIDARNIADQETKVEDLRSFSFMEMLHTTLDDINKSIGMQDLDGLFQLKKRVSDKIRQCSICKLTEHFSDKFISINEQICNKIIDLCQMTRTEFDVEREQILIALGDRAKILPESTINSLATAELLYKCYASTEYAEKGFDYSCISSLYYQAFEDAYNTLLWRKYADFLNQLEIVSEAGSRKFTDILFVNRQNDDLGDKKAKGYLPSTAASRHYYIDYDNGKKLAQVKTSLMYSNFALLLKRAIEGKQLANFRGHLAKTAGFRNGLAMMDDARFMDLIRTFGNSIETAAKDRNNASHGGTLINLNQCEKDKFTVLHELRSAREANIGLIQQLLYLMKNSPLYQNN